jgi:hypothetical protein
MNCNLYKVLNYLKNNNLLTVDDDDEKQIYFYFKLTIPDKFKWNTTLDDLNIEKSGIINRDEYLYIKYKSLDTIVDFGALGKTTLSNVEFNDCPAVVDEYIKQYIVYDKDFIKYIK